MINNKGKRVVFLLAFLHKGGMQKAVSNISCALPSSVEHYIVYFGTENPGFTYQGETVNLNIPGSLANGFLMKVWNFFKRLYVLQEFIDENKIDTVVSFGESANILNLLTRRKKKIISVRVAVQESLHGIYGYCYLLLVKLLYKNADKVITVSKTLAQSLGDHFNVPSNKIQTIYNLYDHTRIVNLSKKDIPPEYEDIFLSPVLINVGSLCYQKGQANLIHAFARAKKHLGNLQLIIIGSGELRVELEEVARSLGVAQYVHLIGFEKNPYKYLAQSNVFVLTSQFEGFPNALVEAMICGLPVVSTNCPTGPYEILGESEHGVLVDNITTENVARVEDEISKAIISLITTVRGGAYRKKAINRAKDFSKDKIILQWVEVLT